MIKHYSEAIECKTDRVGFTSSLSPSKLETKEIENVYIQNSDLGLLKVDI